MGEKVYKPIVKNGDHLIRSKDNPDRVRGLTRDENNQNPDIIEWEEYDLDDLQNYDYDPYPYEERHNRLTPEQEEFARQVGEALSAAIMAGVSRAWREVMSPWWRNSALPWFKEKGRGIKHAVSEKKGKNTTIKKSLNIKQNEPDRRFVDVSSQLDEAFEQFSFEMDEEEAMAHIMKLVYHMIGVVNEIRIIGNARIRKDCESEELCIERQKEVERFLSERVAVGLDQLLSNETLRLDLNTSRELFKLTGGGVRLNGEYVPVQVVKIDEALKAIPM
ncbi:hypothetical protein PG2010B_0019 [Bifidobacterium animalis subsp. lactis]|uniref:hypothetical protein n=1 Tax=Bifidobacterium animalis TaxID=28025 RepID=UPI00101F28D3|nr:hypothetical protein [Bifidobacterium animalis]RYM94931.1 hypothetical protein PG2010B_0019 [Bifidobacterium animalis subsp. lactis]RYM95007.1 hypothetical protein PG2007B_0019 [Bifidobacterium animalis subsp. lactis]